MNKTTRCKQENHLISLQKMRASNTNIKQYNNLLSRLEINNTKKNKTKYWKHKSKRPFSKHNSKQH